MTSLSPIPGLQKLLDHPFYTEGPVIDGSGDIYFTTLTGNRVLKLDAANQLSDWATSACPNGQVILENGDHLVCDSMSASIIRFNSKGNFLKNEVAEIFNTSPVFVPNDVIASKNGGIYFTDSVRHTGNIFFMSNDGDQHTVASKVDYPNGLVLSPDETKLFVAESYQNRVLVIHLKTPGVAAGPPEVYCTLPSHPSGRQVDNLPDGLAIDGNANLWVAHYGMQALQVISADGKLLHSYDTGLPLTSNICIKGRQAIVTGGFGEPGPGAVVAFNLDNLNPPYEI